MHGLSHFCLTFFPAGPRPPDPREGEVRSQSFTDEKTWGRGQRTETHSHHRWVCSERKDQLHERHETESFSARLPCQEWQQWPEPSLSRSSRTWRPLTNAQSSLRWATPPAKLNALLSSATRWLRCSHRCSNADFYVTKAGDVEPLPPCRAGPSLPAAARLTPSPCLMGRLYTPVRATMLTSFLEWAWASLLVRFDMWPRRSSWQQQRWSTLISLCFSNISNVVWSLLRSAVLCSSGSGSHGDGWRPGRGKTLSSSQLHQTRVS